MHVPMSPAYPDTWLVCLLQLPVLKDLQRVIDELAFGVGTPANQDPSSSLIVEQVSQVCQSSVRMTISSLYGWEFWAYARRLPHPSSANYRHASAKGLYGWQL